MMELLIQAQPDDETCGPTTLHTVYRYYGLDIPLEEIIQSVDRLPSGGTLAPMLGNHALKHDFEANIYLYNINLFDPSWFPQEEGDNEFLIQKLQAQMDYKKDPMIDIATMAYINYLQSGGKVSWHCLNALLLKRFFHQNMPIITALSATYLYNSSREIFTNDGKSIHDDIRGTPCGHFVVLYGYDDENHRVVVADPQEKNPLSENQYYQVSITRLINAIMLGVLTHDANLLIIKPRVSPCRP